MWGHWIGFQVAADIGLPLFLTPVGIKTLFPIFENSLCGKELAEKTQTLNATNKDIYFMSKLFKCFFFQTVERRTPDEFFAWQFFGLRVWWVGNLPFVSSKRLQIAGGSWLR